MHDTNYKVKRDKIYVGSLTKVHKDIFTVYNGSKYEMFDSLSDKKKESMMRCYGHLYTHKPSISLTSSSSYYRTMLFILDENNWTNDLLYNCPNYPVMNISKNEDCINS